MDNVILDFRLTLEVGINHLADRRCPICKGVIARLVQDRSEHRVEVLQQRDHIPGNLMNLTFLPSSMHLCCNNLA